MHHIYYILHIIYMMYNYNIYIYVYVYIYIYIVIYVCIGKDIKR